MEELNKYLKLNNSIAMPLLFMSANWFTEKQMCKLFIAGLNCGIRGFDTAREYGVEKKMGKALKQALEDTGIKREEIFIQTRISNFEERKGDTENEVKKSLKYLKLDYLDCFMIHWPTPNYYVNIWKQMEELYQKGYMHSIGICNFRKRHLEKLINEDISIVPHILQIEIQPFWQANDLVDLCKKYNIRIQAFSPLCKMIPKITQNQTLKFLSEKYRVSIPQLILRWDVQRGICPISLTSKINHIKSNYDIFNFIISSEDMAIMKNLDENYKFHLESATCPGF